MTKHTELPWLYDGLGFITAKDCYGQFICKVDIFDEINDPKRRIGYEEQRLNVQFIVKACNSHYELLEALKQCLNDENCLGMLKPDKYAVRRLRAINVIVNQAINKAESK